MIEKRRDSATDAPPTDGALPHGMHALLDGVEYRLILWSRTNNGWALWTSRPRPGFTKQDRAGFIRKIDEDEIFECYRIEHEGTYRGIAVTVSGSSNGRVMVVTRDPRAGHEGFEGFERDRWMKFIPRDDVDLRFAATRSPIPMPWRRDD